jgi:hypothetical protein
MIDGRIPEPARITRQRMAVLDALRRPPEPLSAKDLHAGLGRSVGLATVYRALQGLVDAGRVDLFRRESGEALFRLCNPVHHHHLVCHRCDRSSRSTPAGSSCGRPGWRTATDSPSPITRPTFRVCAACQSGS